MKWKELLCLVLVFALISGTEPAQSQPMPGSDEKIFIHSDRDWYSPGETMWFKVYLFHKGSPSLLSSEAFLQLEDVNGDVICKKRLLVNGATATGNIAFRDNLPVGQYFLKATASDFPHPDFIYQKKILIVGPPPQSSLRKDSLLLDFFPESGQLVDRIRTQVAFKAVNSAGLPVDVHGVIKSDSDVVISRFTALHDGIGRVAFTPHLHDPLYAEVDYKGKVYRFCLPEVKPFGINLKIAEADSGKIFEITRSKQNAELFDTLRLVVKLNADTVFESVIPMGYEQAVKSRLKTTNLPSGILHFIVTSKFNAPLAERLAFVDNKEYQAASRVRVTHRDSSTHGQNSLKLIFPDSTQKSLSYSIIEAKPGLGPDRETICSRYLLTADLRGNVFNPAYYFENDSADRKLALDNLMLTHGWTRYNWKPASVSEISSLGQQKKSHLLSLEGSVFDRINNRAVQSGTLHLQLIGDDSSFQTFDAPVTKEGRFFVDSLLFFGTATIYHSYSTAAGKTIPVSLVLKESQWPPILGMAHSSARKVDEGMPAVTGTTVSPFWQAEGFEAGFKSLDTVYLKTKPRRVADRTNEKYAGTVFRTSGKLVLDNISNPYNDRTTSVVDYILTNIRSVDIYRDEGILVNRRNFSLQSQRNWKVELFLDENVASLAAARSITMDQVAMIKFYEAGFVGVGSQAPGGAVAIYTKHYEDLPNQSARSATGQLTCEGYSITKEFYEPDFTHGAVATKEDNRVTLKWQTLVLNGNEAKEFNIKFTNNERAKKLFFIMEGFDASGKLIHFQKEF